MNAHQRRIDRRWTDRALVRFADGMDSRKYAGNRDFERLVKTLSTGHQRMFSFGEWLAFAGDSAKLAMFGKDPVPKRLQDAIGARVK